MGVGAGWVGLNHTASPAWTAGGERGSLEEVDGEDGVCPSLLGACEQGAGAGLRGICANSAMWTRRWWG